MKQCACLLLLAVASLRAETLLLTHDSQGNLLSQSAAILRRSGYALVSRDPLYGAASAAILDESGRLQPVLWISADDADAGVAEVFLGVQAPSGPASSSLASKLVHDARHQAAIRTAKESGGFGLISRLDCGGPRDTLSGPMFDEHGHFAGWHTPRDINGGNISFLIPVTRFEALLRTPPLPLAAWNSRHDRTREADYSRALSHLWAEDFDGALFYFRQAVEKEPANARAWFHLAFVEGKTGHTKAKLANYRKSIELDPAFAPAHYYLGFSLLMSGDQPGAQAEYRKLKDLDPDWANRLKLFMEAAHVDVLDKPHPPAHPPHSAGTNHPA